MEICTAGDGTRSSRKTSIFRNACLYHVECCGSKVVLPSPLQGLLVLVVAFLVAFAVKLGHFLVAVTYRTSKRKRPGPWEPFAIRRAFWVADALVVMGWDGHRPLSRTPTFYR